MSDGLTVADQLALQQLNHDFAWYLDHQQVEPLVALFTEDAWYRHGSRLSEGRAAIRALFEGRSASVDRVARHVISGLRLAAVGADRATGNSVVVTWAANGEIPIRNAGVHLVADFIDEYQRDADGQWRICRRDIQRVFEAADNPGPVGG